jgi:putative DNA primase/helicase
VANSPASKRALKAVSPSDAPVSKPVDYFTHTDEGNVDRFVSQYGNRIRYDETRDKWYLWRGHWWKEIGYSVVHEAAAKLIRTLHDKAISQSHDSLTLWLHKSMSGSHLREMINRARNIPPICIRESGTWNSSPWLLGVSNGVVDLRTGELCKGVKPDYVNCHSPITFEPTAIATVFPTSLRQIFCERDDLIDYVLTAFGYALTGLTNERTMFILHGFGSNGKSKLLELLAYILGDGEAGYAKSVPANSLKPDNRGNPDAPRNDLAIIADARLVLVNESDLKQGVAESMVKWLTGGDMISARFNHGKPFQYRPRYKIFLSCNHRPVVRGTDAAIWNRLPLIPFEARFEGAGEDIYLIDKWKAEASGILNLLIQYCLKWQRSRLQRPECITVASKEYRTESNPIAPFLDACCAYDPEKIKNSDFKDGVEPNELWEHYILYCHKVREKPEDIRKFKANMEAFGFEQDRFNARRFWRGVFIEKPQEIQVDTP